MKTMKELEKAQKLFKENHRKENPVIQIRIDALKDVLELIDEVCRKGCPDIANLKARIEGEECKQVAKGETK